jgi:hypothetical protein
MTPPRPRIQRLPDDLLVTTINLPSGVTTNVLRGMLASQIYLLVGTTYSASTDDQPARCTGFRAYAGISSALNVRATRAGVSLHNWSSRLGRLQPETVVLVNRSRSIDQDPLLLVEAGIVRALSGAGFSVLNTRSGAPSSARRATRHQRLWAMQTADRLSRLLLDTVFHGRPANGTGGSTHERLTRMLLAAPPRGYDVDDILQLADAAGIPIAGKSPAQRTRRDCTTRELEGTPRLHRTWVGRRTVIFAASLSVRDARRTYRASHPEAPTGPRRPANHPPHR